MVSLLLPKVLKLQSFQSHTFRILFKVISLNPVNMGAGETYLKMEGPSMSLERA